MRVTNNGVEKSITVFLVNSLLCSRFLADRCSCPSKSVVLLLDHATAATALVNGFRFPISVTCVRIAYIPSSFFKVMAAGNIPFRFFSSSSFLYFLLKHFCKVQKTSLYHD